MSLVLHSAGYAEKEIRKEKLPIHDQGENPKAPAPKEMVDLEVCCQPDKSDTHIS